MRRLVLVVLAAIGLLALAAAPAIAGEPGGSGGSGGSGATHHYPITQPPFVEPAGTVCPFELDATFPVQDLYETDYYDTSGTLVKSVVTGPLFGVYTNAATGGSVEVNLSGLGVFTFNPDGSTTVTANGHIGIGLHQTDSPPGRYLVTSGYTVLSISASGVKTLDELDGTSADLCATLAG